MPRRGGFRKGLTYKRAGGRGNAGPMTWKHMKECIEKKYHNTERAKEVITDSATGSIDSVITGIAQNTTAQGRVGTRAFIWSIDVRGTLILDTVDSIAVWENLRVMLVVDKQSNGTTPTIAQVLDLTGGNDEFAFRNLANTNRFNILYDKRVAMNVIAAAGNGTANDVAQHRVNFNISKKFTKGLKVVYDTTDPDGLSGAIKDNNVWMMVYGGQGSFASVEWAARVRYTD